MPACDIQADDSTCTAYYPTVILARFQVVGAVGKQGNAHASDRYSAFAAADRSNDSHSTRYSSYLPLRVAGKRRDWPAERRRSGGSAKTRSVSNTNNATARISLFATTGREEDRCDYSQSGANRISLCCHWARKDHLPAFNCRTDRV